MKNDLLFARLAVSLPLFLSLLLYPALPTEFPMQFASDGSVNYYFPKLLALILLNGIVSYTSWLYFYRVKKQPNLAIRQQTLRYLRLSVMPAFAIITLLVIAFNSHYAITFDLGTIITVILALLFLIIGNLLPKVEARPMFFLPFLKRHVVSKKVWRLLGWGMVISSLLLLLNLQFKSPLFMLGIIILCVLMPLHAALKESVNE